MPARASTLDVAVPTEAAARPSAGDEARSGAVPNPPRPSPPGRRRWVRGEGWAVLQFALSAFAAVALVLVLTLVAFQRAGRAEAVANAQEVSRLAARGVIAPALDATVLAGRPSGLARLDRRVRATLLEEPVLRVVVFRADGSVLYSSEPPPEGAVGDAAAEPQVATVLRTGRGVARSGPPRDPAADLPSGVQVLDVYEPVITASGERLVVKVCRRLAAVSDDSRHLLDSFAPVLVGGVLLLQLVNLPLVVALVSRIRRVRRQDALLLEREIVASDRERRRLATDLHNGVVQDLAGMSMSLSAARSHAEASGEHATAQHLETLAADSRRATRVLRHVLVDLYPPNLQRAGLRQALDDLLESARRRDIEVVCAVDEGLVERLAPDRAALVHRVVHEAVRNAIAHSGARVLELALERDGADGLSVRVADDGRGFATATPDEGHLGLTLMRDLVHESGGTLSVASAPGEGTCVCAWVPLR